jgi:hypothetical protein
MLGIVQFLVYDINQLLIDSHPLQASKVCNLLMLMPKKLTTVMLRDSGNPSV